MKLLQIMKDETDDIIIKMGIYHISFEQPAAIPETNSMSFTNITNQEFTQFIKTSFPELGDEIYLHVLPHNDNMFDFKVFNISSDVWTKLECQFSRFPR